MRDIVILLVTTAFFALCLAYVALCDRIIGPDRRTSGRLPASDREADARRRGACGVSALGVVRHSTTGWGSALVVLLSIYSWSSSSVPNGSDVVHRSGCISSRSVVLLGVTSGRLVVIWPVYGGREDGFRARRPFVRPWSAAIYRVGSGSTPGASSAGPSTRSRCSAFSVVCSWPVYAVSAFAAGRCRSTRRTWRTSTRGRVQRRRELHDQHELAVVPGELTMSHLTQMVGLTVQNFVSAAAGMAVAVAIIRGMARRGRTLGNFWVDLTRTTLRILLPLSFVVAVVLRSRRGAEPHGPPKPPRSTPRSAADVTSSRSRAARSASQVAIKQLGTNGGGFFNTNSAHPFENPNGFTNLSRRGRSS